MNFEQFKDKYQKAEVQIVSSSPSNNPVVSVLVQTYQQKDFIKESLESILMQKTNFLFEILVGDDGSVDGTREICLQIAKHHPEKITLFLHRRENQIKVMEEPTSNFNAFYNLFSARGTYIAFCEGDDVWTDPYKLQKQVDFLRINPQCILTYHRFITINEKGKKIENLLSKNQPQKDLDPKTLQRTEFHPLLLCTVFRNKLREIPTEMAQVLNVDTFLFSLLGNYGIGKYLEEIQPCKYRTHSKGIWSRRIKEKKILSKINTYKYLGKFHKRAGNIDLYMLYDKRVRGNYKMLVYLLIKNGKLNQALKSIFTFTRDRN